MNIPKTRYKVSFISLFLFHTTIIQQLSELKNNKIGILSHILFFNIYFINVFKFDIQLLKFIEFNISCKIVLFSYLFFLFFAEIFAIFFSKK